MKKKLVRIIKRFLHRIIAGRIHLKLGYPKDAKLLIIHADDLGISMEENKACIAALTKGPVNSGSIMVPCEGFQEIAGFALANSNADLGIHLTLTCERDFLRWGPVTSLGRDSGILDSTGCFHRKGKEISGANLDDIEQEFRAQIEKALDAGIDITHLDSHMYTAFSRKDILDLYVKLGKEYRIPVLLNDDLGPGVWKIKDTAVVDYVYCANGADYERGLFSYYRKVLQSMKPGLNCILIHLGFDTPQLKVLLQGQSDFSPAWRQADFDFLPAMNAGIC